MSSACRRTTLFWSLGFALLAAAIVARNLIGLASAPPGLYVDESSIAYNAWAVAHYGVDEHGNHFPLYFQAFGEFKNPLYVYTLVPFVRLLPLSAAVERFPAALFGLITTLFFTLTAWRVTRSRRITLFVLALTALTPWLVQESRVGFEVVSMLAMLSIALWLLSDERNATPARFALAGLFFALAIFAYSTARLEVLLFAAAFAVVYWNSGPSGWWRSVVVIIAGYVVLGVWAFLHPGALTAEFNLISIAADGAPFPALAGRFVSNYLGYFSPWFLFVNGDPNLRHNTGYAGMLLAISAPLLLLGLWGCWKRRHERLPRLLIACLVLGPVAASLTNTFGAPHALRGAVMLPFYVLLMVYGLDAARGMLQRFPVLPALGAAALVVQGGLYTLDFFTGYPVRAASEFDDGVVQAISAAKRLASPGHSIFLSTSFDDPYIQAFVVSPPVPPSQPVSDVATPGLRQLGMVVADASTAESAAMPGDLVVLDVSDGPPSAPDWRLVDRERGPTSPLQRGEAAQDLVDVYLRTPG